MDGYKRPCWIEFVEELPKTATSKIQASSFALQLDILIMDLQTYLNSDNWLGSYYELAIELQDSPNDSNLFRALKSLWGHPSLSGGWPRKEDYGQSATNFSGEVDKIESFFHMYGLVTLPTSNIEFGCLTVVVREEIGKDHGSDWLNLCFPTGMLEQAFSVEYPLDCKSNDVWIDQVDALLKEIANSIYEQVKFELAIIGEEVSGYVHKADLPFADNESGYLITPPVWNSIWASGSKHEQPEYMQLSSGLKQVL